MSWGVGTERDMKQEGWERPGKGKRPKRQSKSEMLTLRGAAQRGKGNNTTQMV